MPLDLPQDARDFSPLIEVYRGTAGQFAQMASQSRSIERADWYHYALGPDGATYVCWQGVGEYIVSAHGDRVWCERAPEATEESFQVYLLGQALSVALVKRGFEPWHGTAVECDGDAIALLGDSGYGKSTLAASLLSSGHWRLVTDDLLLIRPAASELRVSAGPARIKLLPDAARHLLRSQSTGVRMNPLTNKHVIPLNTSLHCPTGATLRAIYVLAPPTVSRLERGVRIEPLDAREAFLALIQNTFNRFIVDPERLRRQLAEATQLVRGVRVRRLLYPRCVEHLIEVQTAIFEDSGLSGSRAA